VIIGTVHSGVQMGIHKVARDTGVLTLIPNAGVHAATRALCAPNVFRTSFTNSQPTLALGKVLVDKGLKKAVWITWKYAAGDEAFEGFKESYTKAGGTIVKELGLPFPNVEFQALLTEIAAIKPDVVVCFFAGGGAAKFIKDYAAAGLKGKIPLYGSGFLTEGVLDAAGPAADGIVTTMHYSDSLDTARNKKFRLDYAKTYKSQPDVYAVQGYDTGLLLIQGANAVKGDLNAKPALYKAMEGAVIDSPRPMDFANLPHPVAQQRAVRPAAVHAGRRPDADLRHHGRGQPGAWQLLHAGRLPGLFALRLVRQPDAGHLGGAVLSVVFGLALEWLLFRHFYQRDHLDQVLLTFGLIYIFEEVRSMLWGDDVHGVPIPDFLGASIPLTDTLSYPVYRLFMSGVCIVLAIGLYLLISKTRLGMKIRAGAFNRDMAESLGINIKLIHARRVCARRGPGDVAGMVAAPISSVYPNMGSQVLIMCFVVVVIGGIGSVRGALISALLVGLVDTFGKVLLPQVAGMLVYMLMAAVLLWKPEGLFKQ
jgi:branched-subunit amino acid ABC-type transport system permease component